LHPEVDLVDELFYRIVHRLPAGDVAAPEVVAVLRNETLTTTDDKSASLAGWDLQGSRLCLATDAPEDHRYLFTLGRRSGKLFVMGIQDVSAESFGKSCSDVLASKGKK
jgi:hypothetical protein